MPFIKIKDITVSQRQRDEHDPKFIESLAESIRLVGLINAIVLDENMKLVAGMGRIQAHELLGRDEIEYSLKSDLPEWMKEVMELEENIRRAALSPANELLAKDKIHTSYTAHYGKQVSMSSTNKREVWRMKDTAALLDISVGTVHEHLKLAKAVRDRPELRQLKTISAIKSEVDRTAAGNVRKLLAGLKAKEQRDKTEEAGGAIQSRQFEEVTENGIRVVNAGFEEVIPTLSDSSIGCLITDPPWEVKFDEKFGTDSNIGLSLTKDMLQLVRPKLSPDACCYMFCATKHLIRGTIYGLLTSVGFRVLDQLLIWYKPHVAHSSNPYRELKNDYEPCIVFSPDEMRSFNRPEYAVQKAVIQGHRLHPAQKPEEVVNTIIDISTVSGETILDPFCGSGVVGRVARSMGRRALLIEKDPGHYATAVDYATGKEG